MNKPPVPISMVLCEQVIIEDRTHNVTPVNCFNFRELDVIPGHATLVVLAWLADGVGQMIAEISVERLDTLEEIYRDQRTLVFSDTLREYRFLARIRECEFPSAGQYQVSLTIDHELIAIRKLRIHMKGSP